MKKEKKYPIYGVMAEFDNPKDLLGAAKRVYDAGYRTMDAFTPYPIEEVSEVIGFHRRHNKVALICLIGGLVGMCFGFGLCSTASAYLYPLNIAGRPYIPWPMFIPITFECTVLFAGLSTLVGMLALNGLPRPYHPVFNVPGFSTATNDRFFLVIEARDAMYDQDLTSDLLRGLGAQEVTLVDG